MIAQVFAERGARLVLTGRTASKLEAAVLEITDENLEALADDDFAYLTGATVSVDGGSRLVNERLPPA